MIDVEPLIRRDLDKLMPLPPELQPDWADVQSRVRPGRSTTENRHSRLPGRFFRGARRRPLRVLGVAVVLIVVPVTALAVTNTPHWWFLGMGSGGGVAAYQPANGKVVVIRRGSWNGVGWVLTGYASRSGALCFQVTQTANQQGAAGCGSVPGAKVSGSRQPPITISYQSSGGGPAGGLPRYIVGPVVATASEVVIHLVNGTVIRTPTFAVPSALGLPIRFYATQAPAALTQRREGCREQALAQAAVQPATLVGLDSSGKVVASLARQTPGMIKKLALGRCNPALITPIGPPAGTASLKPVRRYTAPYGATATLLIGHTFKMAGGVLLPSGHVRHIERLSRCWEVTFANGRHQGSCPPVAKRRNPELGFEVEHVGRATFVVVTAPPRTGFAITRVALQLANGHLLTARPVDGIAVFAIPRAALSTLESQRGFRTAYGNKGQRAVFDNTFAHVQSDREAVYYRSCPSTSSCYRDDG